MIATFKKEHIDKCDRIENSEINPGLYAQLNYDKGSKNTQ